MKILILFLMIISFVTVSAPLCAKECKWNLPWNKACRKQTIEKDSKKGYSDTQRDPHQRKAKTNKKKKDAGYYNGEYHNRGKNFRATEHQFVDDAQ